MKPLIFLDKKLEERKAQNAYRELRLPQKGMIDFCSNDYLGIVKNNLLSASNCQLSLGSTGSRLLTGNYPLIEKTEKLIAHFHNAEAALIFNSGYDANVGLLSCVPQKGDSVIYDNLCHASIRDGIRLSLAQAFPFQHNTIDDLRKKLQHAGGNIFVVTESVFSMDGDVCPLQEICELCNQYNAYLIIDEAHATGIIGGRGEGLVQHLQMQQQVFARVHTFGKACGCHGAVIVGTQQLVYYLINFARSFMYSTALPEEAIANISKSYEVFPAMLEERAQLIRLINTFQETAIKYEKLVSQTPVQGIVVPGNDTVKMLSRKLQANNLDVRPILYPTVPKGKERLRIVLHSFNTNVELETLLHLLQ